MKISKKSVISILVSAIICTAITFSSVYAYMSWSGDKVNKLTIGDVTVSVEEKFDKETPKPGGSIHKEPSVRNTGVSSCFTRVRVLYSDDYYAGVSTVDYNTADWELKSDGYYYYKKSLDTNAVTTPLFTNVTFSNTVSAGDLHNFDIIIYAEAVQQGSYADSDYDKAWTEFLEKQIAQL